MSERKIEWWMETTTGRRGGIRYVRKGVFRPRPKAMDRFEKWERPRGEDGRFISIKRVKGPDPEDPDRGWTTTRSSMPGF